MSDRRHIPSVDRAVRAIADLPLPRPLATRIARQVLAAVREEGGIAEDAAFARVRAEAERVWGSRMQTVLNGTGVIIHTNLGRSPLAPAAVDAVCRAAGEYNTLEYDCQTGERGRRGAYVEVMLAAVCDAEAATVVNNCAAALLLMLRHFTRGSRKEVIISRGELVQIGGGFRVPEILEAGGATLREVGTTNRTSLEDYAAAIGESTALVLKVHRSNFWMEGFVEFPPTASIANLAKARSIPFAEDLGSGATSTTSHVGLGKTNHLFSEPTPADVLNAGADLVCFSGDKLFGGPQAGIIAGKAAWIMNFKAEPLFRALRCDKMVLAALEATAEAHLVGNAEALPTVAMLQASEGSVLGRAERLAQLLESNGIPSQVVQSIARVGGGSLPRAEIPSAAVQLAPPSGVNVEQFAQRLRMGRPPVIGYIENGCLRFDVRTLFAAQETLFVDAIRRAFGAA